MKLLIVDWYDTESKPEWTEKDDTKKWGNKYCEIRSVGFLIDDNKKCLVLCAMYNDNDFGDIHKIPKGCIKKIKHIKY